MLLEDEECMGREMKSKAHEPWKHLRKCISTAMRKVRCDDVLSMGDVDSYDGMESTQAR